MNLNQNLAGPLEVGEAVKRDAQIPEKNDGKPFSEKEWVEAAEKSSGTVIELQNLFFEELRKRESAVK